MCYFPACINYITLNMNTQSYNDLYQIAFYFKSQGFDTKKSLHRSNRVFKKKFFLHRLCQNPVFKRCITVLMHRMRNTNNILTEYWLGSLSLLKGNNFVFLHMLVSWSRNHSKWLCDIVYLIQSKKNQQLL